MARGFGSSESGWVGSGVIWCEVEVEVELTVGTKFAWILQQVAREEIALKRICCKLNGE